MITCVARTARCFSSETWITRMSTAFRTSSLRRPPGKSASLTMTWAIAVMLETRHLRRGYATIRADLGESAIKDDD